MAKRKNLFLYLALVLIVILNLGILYLNLDFEEEIEKTPLEEAIYRGEIMLAFWEEWLMEKDFLGEEANRFLAQGYWELERSKNEKEANEALKQFVSRIQTLVSRENHLREAEGILRYIENEFVFETSQGHFLVFLVSSGEIKLVEGQGKITPPENIGGKLNYLEKMGPVEILWNEGTVEVFPASQFNEFLEKKDDLIKDKDKVIQEKDRIIADWQRRWQQLARDSGYEVMEGPGIEVSIHDVQGGFRNDQIVHDTDIRRIVNELFAAGAKGLEVGGERLVATSAIRCGGPVILVNQNPVPVDPVIIKAVGSPEVLTSALQIVKNELAVFGVKVSIEIHESVSLGKKDR